MELTHEGQVVKSTGSWYSVRDSVSGQLIQARIKGKLRLIKQNLNNPIAVGDYVRFFHEPDAETVVIGEVLPRKNYVLRSSTHKRHHLHIIAANVDQVFIVSSIVQPNVKPGFIDRLLLTLQTQDIPVSIIINKLDLYAEEELAVLNELQRIYENIGISFYVVSVEKKLNLDILKAKLAGKVTLCCGHSGVGKSSLLNTLMPELDLKVGEISDYTGKGQHTTTFAEMFELGQTKLIDTPGIKELGFINLNPIDVAHNYPEFFKASVNCRFGANCLHANEPGCEVKRLIETDELSIIRYNSYLSVLEETQNLNYWERKTDW